MITLLLHLLRLLPILCGGHRQVALENLALRQQLVVYKRTATRPRIRETDRLFWVWLTRIWTGWKQPLVIVTPDPALRGPPARQRRDQGPRHANGRRQPALGRPANPRRAPQARPRRGRAPRLPADAEAALAAVADVANVSNQSCPGLGRDRFLHRAHRSPPRSLRPRRARPPPPARPPLQRDRTSHERLDR